ncbi:GlxA family transcriptional regulator [Roseateles aquae]|uniref:GlxA family transcriptional regulator n=1 Tax=Roseateles aquae TaxID=3077235 RepID=UPI0028F0B12C|nr:DJ-1/PfpI family protein [Paucibacter sp. APW11]
MSHKDIRTADSASVATREIGLIIFDGVEALDVAAPASAFAKAAELVPGAYRVRLLSPTGGLVTTNAGLQLAASEALSALEPEQLQLDTLLIAGGDEAALRHAIIEQGLGAWLARAAPRLRRVASICTGAFALAAAGLLDGRRATTHWHACDLLAELSPRTDVLRERIFVHDGPVWTSAGVSTGLDLTLALIEADLGRTVAVSIARQLALFMLRGGSDPQLSPALAAQAQAGQRIRELLAWLVQHLQADLSVPALAARACMSERQFSRAFRQQTGLSPARFVAQARLDRACSLLADNDWPQEKIAQLCGFGSTDALQRACARQHGLSPEALRRRRRTGPA